MALSAAGAQAQAPEPPQTQPEPLRPLISDAREQAIAKAQRALADAPDDATVRKEYIQLHLALAREWIASGGFSPALTALEAVLAVDREHVECLNLKRSIEQAGKQAVARLDEIVALLRSERFESALDLIEELRGLVPDHAQSFPDRRRRAMRGAADDHYLAGNFSEAFALYERHDTLGAPGEQLDDRWAISLVLALVERGERAALPRRVREVLMGRIKNMMPKRTPLRFAVDGLFAEAAGRRTEAGRSYAAGLGEPWSLPAVERRQGLVDALRSRMIDDVRERYGRSRTRDRGALWRIALPGVLKHKRTANSDVSAANDFVAERVAQVAELHLPLLADWLGVTLSERWDPPCEMRVYETMAALHQATESSGETRAVTRMRTRGGRVLLRQVSLLQNDPWLLGGTLPRELTHLLLADAFGAHRIPAVLDEGLALQAEPPARQLQFRRALRGPTPDASVMLQASSMAEDSAMFHAQCNALTRFMLAYAPEDPTGRSAVSVVLKAFAQGYNPNWWGSLGFEQAQEMTEAWERTYERLRDPLRMPLMVQRAESQGASPR